MILEDETSIDNDYNQINLDNLSGVFKICSIILTISLFLFEIEYFNLFFKILK